MRTHLSRRQLLQTGLASSALYMLAGGMPIRNVIVPVWAQDSAGDNARKNPFNIGLITHKTGAYTDYGLWVEAMAQLAVETVNRNGGVNGHMLNLIVTDDKSSAKQARQNMVTLNNQKCDAIIGGVITSLSDDCIAVAEQLKTPYLSCSGTDLIAQGKANRYVFQPAIADLTSHIIHSANWLNNNLGRKITVIFPDKSDDIARNINQLNDALANNGAEILQYIKIPPQKSTKDSMDAETFSAYFHQIPIDTQVIYYLFNGENASLLLKSLADYYDSNQQLNKPIFFGMMEAWENIDVEDVNMTFLENSYFIEYHPRYAHNTIGKHETAFRTLIGLNERAQKTILETNDTPETPTPQYNIAPDTTIMPYGKLAAIWETVFFIRNALLKADYQNRNQRNDLIEAMENIKEIPYSLQHPQGRKIFNGRMHQVFAHHYISKRERGRVKLIATTPIDNFYPYRSVDYTTQELS
ncbi:MAG: ABC transporter substrate-binding protein [Alphaproteobacteria bacterium]|nr:ABC transporter substrate-binding protein [Alphaproteobacteria bacterium]